MEVLKWRHLIRFSNVYGLALDIHRQKLSEKSSSLQFWTVGIFDGPWMLIDGKLSIVDHSNLFRSCTCISCVSQSRWWNILSGVPYQLCCIPFVLMLLDYGNSIFSGLPKFPNPAWILSDLRELLCKERRKCMLLKYPDTCIQTDKLQLCGLCYGMFVKYVCKRSRAQPNEYNICGCVDCGEIMLNVDFHF